MQTSKPIVAVYDSKPYDREYLCGAGSAGELELRFFDFRLCHETVFAAAKATAVCVFVNDMVDRPALEKLAGEGVRLVALRCAGFNNVDLVAAAELGIRVTRVPSYSPHAVAEHTLALILTLNRKIHRAFNRVREQNFSLGGLVGCDLQGKTAGVIGTGRIGRLVAQILRGFGMRVLVQDLFPDPAWAATYGAEYVEIEEIFRTSDIISLHAPLTPESNRMIRAETIALTKPGVMIVNVSRGRLIDTGDLIHSLKSGHIGGVALDVYEEEEGVFFEDLSGQVLQDDELARLLTFPNVLVTAHQAFLTHEALSEIARVTVENIVAFSKKRPFLEGTALG